MYQLNLHHSSGAAEQIPARLRQALLAADADYRASAEALRDAVCDFVEDHRGRGIPLDDTVDAVRAVVSRMRYAGAIPLAQDGAADELVDQLVAWCREFGG